MNEKPAIVFKISKSGDNYEIISYLIEEDILKKIRCIRNIEDKKFAEFMLKIIKWYWNDKKRIMRFVDIRRRGTITKYCEFHDIEEIEKFKKQYQELEKLESSFEKLDKKLEKIKKMEKEAIELSKKLKTIQKEMEEMKL